MGKEEQKMNVAYIDSDDDDFSESEEEKSNEPPSKGFFSRLSNSISLFAGGKKLTADDLHPILEQFKS